MFQRFRDEGDAMPTAQPLQGRSIMIAHRSIDSSHPLVQYLIRCGAQVSCAQRFERAVDVLQHPPGPDVVLIGRRLLGRGSGNDLAQWLSMVVYDHLAHTKRIYLTATPRDRMMHNTPAGLFHAYVSLDSIREVPARILAAVGEDGQ